MQNTPSLPTAVVVIPTYNEVENIRKLIPILCSDIFPKISKWNMRVVVVDGNSPDKTAEEVVLLAKTYPNVEVIKESKKNGIGSAYMEGFAYSIKNLNADVVIEFDADFQHPPETLITIMSKVDEGFDYVIGSRVVSGGSEPAGRNIFRTFLTEFGGFTASFILFFPGKYFSRVTDPTSGLRATRVKGVLDKLDLSPTHLYSKQFGYKLQLLSETLVTGARYAEIPLNFGHRMAGVSKFEAGTAFDILKTCIKTRMSAMYRTKTKN